MNLVVCEISLTQVRYKMQQDLLNKDNLNYQSNSHFYYAYDFETIKDIKKILQDKIIKLKEKEMWFTGVNLDIFEQLKDFIKSLDIQSYKILDYNECTVKYFYKQSKNIDDLYGIDFVSVDKFINTPLVKELANKHQKIEKFNYPFYIADIRKNIKLLKVFEDGSHEQISETVVGEMSFISLIKFLKKTQNLDWKGIDDLMQNYLSYDVDITVGDIYGQDFQGFLMKNLVASSMGKNDGTKIKCFLKSFCYNTAFQLSNLSAMLIKQENQDQKVQVFIEMDICKHPFSFFFINSIINFYSQNYKFADIQPVFIKNQYNSCLDFCNQINK